MEKVLGFPEYLIIFAVILAPFSEELFFRAFLTPKIGVIGAAVVFALSHIAYGSIVEVVGAFVLGLIFSLVYVRSKSITPCIAMHIAYNALAIFTMMRF